MNRFKWAACCAVAASFLSWGAGGSWGQFGGRAAAEEAEPAKADVPHDFCRCVGETGPAVARIKQALEGPLIDVGMDFTDTPLDEVVSQLQEDYNIPIQLDLPALDLAGLGPDEPVNISLRNISFRSALRLMLKQLQLTYLIREEVLIITTPEEAETQLMVCVYDVRDLTDADHRKEQIAALMTAVMATVAVDTWAEHGGVAEIRPLPPGLLVISQTHAVHEEIRELLAVIREMSAEPPAGEGAGLGGGGFF